MKKKRNIYDYEKPNLPMIAAWPFMNGISQFGPGIDPVVPVPPYFLLNGEDDELDIL